MLNYQHETTGLMKIAIGSPGSSLICIPLPLPSTQNPWLGQILQISAILTVPNLESTCLGT